MFECLICKKNGIDIKKRNLVPHIKKKHPEINGDTKKYMEMFPDAKLREAPKTAYSNPEYQKKSMEKSIESRRGKSLSEDHKKSIGESNKNSEKHKESRKKLSKEYKDGERTRKINLPIEEVRKLYFEKKYSIGEIAEEYGYERHSVSRWFEENNIEKRNLSETIRLSLNDKKELNPLTQHEKDILYGLLLGDGCLSKPKGATPYYRHSSKYPEFLVWIKSLFPNVNWGNYGIVPITNKKSEKDAYGTHSCIHPDFAEIYEEFYAGKNGAKIIPPNININSTVLLHWFLGDGSYSDYKDKNGKIKRDLYFSTFAFSEDSIFKYIIPQLNAMGIFCKVKKKSKGPVIIIYAESYKRFYEVIGGESPIPCYDYKYKIVKEKFPELLYKNKQFNDIDKAFSFFRETGFPMIQMDNNRILKSFEELKNREYSLRGNIIGNSKVGLKLANSYQNHRYYVKNNKASKNAIEAFSDDDILKKVLRACLDRNGCINGVDVRNRLAFWGNCTPYNFKPMVAKYIYENYSKEGDTVLDPCAGWGGRLLGCLAVGDRKYIGVEPESPNIFGMKKMAKDLGFEEPQIYKDAFEDVKIESDEVSLVFTSPPYFNLEEYNPNSLKQSTVRYKKYEEWKEGFLRILINKSHDLLKEGGYFCIAIKNNKEYAVADDFEEMAGDKFELVKKYYIEYNKNPFDKNKEPNHEPLFVFRKNKDGFNERKKEDIAFKMTGFKTESEFKRNALGVPKHLWDHEDENED